MKSSRATLILRIPSLLHQRLKEEARHADTSLNKHCITLLDRRTGKAASEGVSTSLSFATAHSDRMVSLQDLSAGVIEAWKKEIEKLVLFGSFARGRQTANSDIDLLVVLDGNVTLDRDIYARWQFHRFNAREVAPLFVHIPGTGERIGGLWFEVALDGIVLYDRDLHLSRFLSRVRELVAEGRVKRMVTHGHPYWVHTQRTDEGRAPAGES